MVVYLGFLRAVNVGKRQVKMAALRERLTADGFSDVETYIASGNIKVSSSLRSTTKVEQALEAVFEEWLGFDVPTLVRTPKQLTEIYERGRDLVSPVGDSRHYLTFLRDKPAAAAVTKLESWAEAGERANVDGREVHLWLASARPKLTNSRVEAILGTVGTARDWKTITKLASTWC